MLFVFVDQEIVGLARTNRRDVLAAGEIQVVHCVNRCVRRAYLCGHDPLTGTKTKRGQVSFNKET